MNTSTVKHSSLKENSNKIAQDLAHQFNIDFVIVGKILPGHKVSTLAFYNRGTLMESFVYPLQHTPCENISYRTACYYPNNVQTLFPQDKELKDLDIHSYLGAPIMVKGKRVGLIALMDSKEITDADNKILVLDEKAKQLSEIWE